MHAAQQDFTYHITRRKNLTDLIRHKHSEAKGALVLIAGFEQDRARFWQECSFYYLTGLEEPGVIAVIDLQGEAVLYIPHCGIKRSDWLSSPVELVQENSALLGFDRIETLGAAVPGFSLPFFFTAQQSEKLLKHLASIVQSGGQIFTLSPNDMNGYAEQRSVLARLATFAPVIGERIVDISPLVAGMRRVKSSQEVEYMYRAVEITALAHEAAAKAIGDGVGEAEVQASLEYMMLGSGARVAYPSIVASGINSTILHYNISERTMWNGELIVIDAGAAVGGYCADITRTYPVSGTFTERQREIYKLVLEVQRYVADLAKPGMWLSNKEYPEQSLNHLAKKYLQDRGYGEYFPHSIGHFLGLDVHDVGDAKVPLQAGDIITIEPGIYIPQEKLGVRIEDNYLITEKGAICLSEDIPKQLDEVQKLVRETFSR